MYFETYFQSTKITDWPIGKLLDSNILKSEKFQHNTMQHNAKQLTLCNVCIVQGCSPTFGFDIQTSLRLHCILSHCVALHGKYILKFRQIYFKISTNTFNFPTAAAPPPSKALHGKYILKFTQIQIKIRTNTFQNKDKYIWKLGQIHFKIRTNTFQN